MRYRDGRLSTLDESMVEENYHLPWKRTLIRLYAVVAVA